MVFKGRLRHCICSEKSITTIILCTPTTVQWTAEKAGDATSLVMIVNTESKTVSAKNDDRYEFLTKHIRINRE